MESVKPIFKKEKNEESQLMRVITVGGFLLASLLSLPCVSSYLTFQATGI
jgi:hypothetical protein